MADDRSYRRRSTDSQDTMLRLARLEEQHLALAQRMDAHLADSADNRRLQAQNHRDILSLIDKVNDRFGEAIEKLDDRTNALVIRVSVAFGIVGALWTVANLFAPSIQQALGVAK